MLQGGRLLRRWKSTGFQSPTSVETAKHDLGVSKAQVLRKLRRQKLKEHKSTGSLIDETLKDMETNVELQETMANLKRLGQKKLTREEKKRRRRSLQELGVPSFSQFLKENGFAEGIERKPTTLFQMNIGLYCNQACTHCHVESSPKRTKEQMDLKTAERCMDLIKSSKDVHTVDITGGAPELNSEVFRFVVEEASKLGLKIIDRCNLTVLSEPGQEDLVDFLAKHKVNVVASLPCYSLKNVDQQRGNGVFDRSISGLLKLNEAGYGIDEDLKLDLVYNPLGPFLPPNQQALQEQYKKELGEAFGIQFNSLYCLANLPIKRFADFLHRRGELKDYMELLVNNFNPSTVDKVMCVDYISVSWDGKIYDCDFNQQLAMNTDIDTVFDMKHLDEFQDHKIKLGSHCFACVAGSGSSCQGEL